jgi:hypothetical protein
MAWGLGERETTKLQHSAVISERSTRQSPLMSSFHSAASRGPSSSGAEALGRSRSADMSAAASLGTGGKARQSSMSSMVVSLDLGALREPAASRPGCWLIDTVGGARRSIAVARSRAGFML